jgi:hypothetical protein
MRTLAPVRRLSGLVLAALAFGLAGPAAAQTPAPGTPAAPAAPVSTAENPLEVELRLPVGDRTATLDWGRVGLEETVYGSIRVVNESDAPIRILAMRASCTCTALDTLEGTTLAPGESRAARITVDTRSIPGTIRNQVRFVFSDQTSTAVQLVFEASRAVETSPAFIDALAEPFGVVRVRSVDGRPFRILSSHGSTPIYAFAYDAEADEPRSEYTLVWNLDGYDPQTCLNAAGEPMPLWWVIETDHPGAPLVDLRVRHDPCTRLDGPNAIRRWYLSRNHAMLGRMPAGASKEFEVEMKWLRNAVVNDVIDRVSEDDDRFDAELVSVTRDGDQTVAVIRITLSENARGLVYGRMTVHGEDPRNSQFVPIIAQAADPARVAADRGR